MHLLCSDHLGTPLAGMKVHPSRSRIVGFSASRDEAFLWGWESGISNGWHVSGRGVMIDPSEQSE